MDTNKNKTGGVKSSIGKSMREIAPFMNLGIQMTVPIVGFVFLGLWLDGKNNSSPLWVLIFAAFGLFLAFYYFIKAVKQKKPD